MDDMYKKAKNTLITGNKPKTRSNTIVTQNSEIASTTLNSKGNLIEVEPLLEVGDTSKEFYINQINIEEKILYIVY